MFDIAKAQVETHSGAAATVMGQIDGESVSREAREEVSEEPKQTRFVEQTASVEDVPSEESQMVCSTLPNPMPLRIRSSRIWDTKHNSDGIRANAMAVDLRFNPLAAARGSASATQVWHTSRRQTNTGLGLKHHEV